MSFPSRSDSFMRHNTTSNEAYSKGLKTAVHKMAASLEMRVKYTEAEFRDIGISMP